MKHFNVTIHPKLEDTNLSASDIHHGRWTERTLGMAKRLTIPECAAEYWKVMTGLYDGHGKQARERRATLERFATLPHFDDVIA